MNSRDASVTVHKPVLVEEILSWSQPERMQVWVDGTVGGGGHWRALRERMPMDARLIGIDRDPTAIDRLRLQPIGEAGTTPREDLFVASYIDLPEVLAKLGVPGVDGILLDLGLSSDQLEDRERGFSFRFDSPLDLRFNPNEGRSAAEWIARLDEESLANLIYEYGEERMSRRIARAIVESRRETPIETTHQLYNLIHAHVRGGRHGRVDAATRTFQALRIAVNEELDHVEAALKHLPDCLNPGGRLLVISFHSLEDRLVKHAFKGDPRLQNLTKKPIVASNDEVRRNPRSRSAKLRVAEKR